MDEDYKRPWRVLDVQTGVSLPLAEYVSRTTKILRDRDNAKRSVPAELVPKLRDRAAPNPSRHQRLCQVCRHPDREAIEHDFLDWRSPIEIAIQYKLSDRASVVRHARAASLVEVRRHNVRAALERVIERAEEADVNGHFIVSAVRTYLRITDDGQLVEPPTRIHFSVERSRRASRSPDWFGGTKRLSGRRLQKPRKRVRK